MTYSCCLISLFISLLKGSTDIQLRSCYLSSLKVLKCVTPKTSEVSAEAVPSVALQSSTNPHRLFYLSLSLQPTRRQSRSGKMPRFAQRSITCSRDLRWRPNRTRSTHAAAKWKYAPAAMHTSTTQFPCLTFFPKLRDVKVRVRGTVRALLVLSI